MYEPAIDQNADHPPAALGNGDEIDRLPPRDLRQWNAMERGDLFRIGAKLYLVSAPHYHRRDEIARTRRIIVEHAERMLRTEPQAGLLVQLSQRRFDGGLALVAASTRQGPLAAVKAQAMGATRQQKRGRARPIGSLDERDRDRRRLEPERRITGRQTGKRGTACRDVAAAGLVEGLAHPI